MSILSPASGALAAVAIALQPPPEARVEQTAQQGARLLPIAIVLIVVVLLALFIGRRALRAAGVSTEKRATSAAEREEAFMAMTLAMHEAARKRAAGEPLPAATRNSSASVAAVAGLASAFDGAVHCPACAASLGATGALAKFVTKCPSCGRRLDVRVEGTRVIVDVDVSS